MLGSCRRGRHRYGGRPSPATTVVRQDRYGLAAVRARRLRLLLRWKTRDPPPTRRASSASSATTSVLPFSSAMVIVDNPRGSTGPSGGGSVAAPVFAEIMRPTPPVSSGCRSGRGRAGRCTNVRVRASAVSTHAGRQRSTTRRPERIVMRPRRRDRRRGSGCGSLPQRGCDRESIDRRRARLTPSSGPARSSACVPGAVVDGHDHAPDDAIAGRCDRGAARRATELEARASPSSLVAVGAGRDRVRSASRRARRSQSRSLDGHRRHRYERQDHDGASRRVGMLTALGRRVPARSAR